MKEIIIVNKEVSKYDKAKLTKAGYIVITSNSVYAVTCKPIGETINYEFTLCGTCGERIYFSSERFSILKKNGRVFYCTYGHSSRFII